MKRHLQCAEQQVSPSNLTKYRACHTEWLACLIVVTYETSFTMRGATGVTIQPQILRLPHRMTRMLDRRHIWNVIYNARSNKCHHPTSPNTAPATQNDSHAWSSSHMKRHLQCAEQQVSPSNLTKYCACHEKWLACLIVVTYETSFPMRGATGITIQPHQILRLPRKMTLQDFKENLQKQVKRHFQCGADPTMIRAWSEHDPTMKTQTATASQVRLLFQLTTSIFYCKIQRFAPNLTFKPSPNTAPTTKRYTWPSPSAAPATKSDTWGSPSTAHTTWLACLIVVTYETSFPMRGATGITIQPHQILRLAQNMTLQDFQENLQKQVKRHFQCGADPTMIRAWSDHENANRNPPRKWGYFSSSPRAFSIVKYNVSRPILHSNLHQILRLPRKVTLERHQVLHLPRKVTLELHQVLHLPRKVTLELHYSTLLDSTWLYSTLLDCTLLDSTLLDSTWLYLILLDSSWLYSTLLDSTLLYLTLLDSTWFYLTLVDSTLLDSTWLYSTLLDSTWFYLTLVDSTWFYLTLVDSTLLDSTWLYSTLLELYLILLDSSWLYSTRLYLTLLYSTWLYLTLLDSTWLYSTWLYLTLLYLTLLDFNLTGMSFVYRKFLS